MVKVTCGLFTLILMTTALGASAKRSTYRKYMNVLSATISFRQNYHIEIMSFYFTLYLYNFFNING